MLLRSTDDPRIDMNYFKEALELHRRTRGKFETRSKVPLNNRFDLSVAYTPGVAEPCRRIAADPEAVWDYTSRGNTVAVVTDGTAVLGLGDIGPRAALPVMEGKAILFKEFADIDAVPICLDTRDTEEIIATVKALSPSFGGINLEDISAPRCFEVEERLRAELDIPVFHDDQHGTAVVVLAGLINALAMTGRTFGSSRVTVSGAGAAGVAITDILISKGVRDILVVDSRGIISKNRPGLGPVKRRIAQVTNPESRDGSLEDAFESRDVFIGVSAPGIVSPDMVRRMNSRAIVFALSNPLPEIMPREARIAGAEVVATGRSDFPNQINNVLAFPGIFRGAFDARAKTITEKMKLAAAQALADHVGGATPEHIVPDTLDRNAAKLVAKAVREVVS